ncbi:HAMP domain-containing sensor histidine kinase [Nocardioides sp. TF02-7]|uniref:sensor histidine kinase n=1 Tax=Nocardioides sp. TF02-7 TaxID=2917724 RepID=UPI001F063762|nr:HAMP domain-containing sensor histidine kinase [Nocardioides sp. TF02-7]UMG91355.1 HAMP domain-containing histidine kinase [Nocardioides sp. TF02-7]
MPLSAVTIAVLVLTAWVGAVPASLLLAAAAFVTIGATHYAGAHRAALREREEQLAAMTARLTAVDAEHRSSRARMHEIRSTVAGIVSATQLLKSLPAERRESFESMVDAEMDRLMRILKGGDRTASRPVELDELLVHLVTSHRARGRTITWQPSGLLAVGRYDDVAEAVNVLIDNAAVHGNADDIRVHAERDGDQVTISVTDSGPGVAVEMRDRLFQWGERRADSPGQGIGLHVAQALVQQLGGDLELDVSHARGTRFVVRLPAVPAPVRLAPLQPVELGVAS